MKEDSRIIILGAGMAGLSTGITFKRAGFNPIILEKENYPGGLFSSLKLGECDFDFGPKILLLDKSSYKEEILSYLNGNYENYPVKESVYLSKYGLLPFPLQRHLFAVPKEEREKIMESLRQSQNFPKEVYNFKSWIINNYGEYFANEILIPYEEKKWQICLDKMDYRWALKRPVKVDLNEVISGSKECLPPNRSYYYPKKGNISELTQSMAKDAGNIILNQEIISIDLDKKKITTRNSEYYYDFLVSTIPVDWVVNVTKSVSGKQKNESASKLKHLSIVVFSLVFKGNFNLEGTAIYFPEKEFIFRRVSVLENLCPALKREGETPISVEISLNPNKKNNLDQLYKKIMADLQKIDQFAQMGDPIHSKILKVSFAYPLQVRGHYNHIADIHRYYASHDIYHCGRGGSFEYYNGDEAYKHGAETALKMIKKINYTNYNNCKNMQNKLTLTVGLPSYKSGSSIIETVKSIRASEGVDNFKIIISVDGSTMNKEIEQRLMEINDVEIIHNEEREGQTARNKQIVKLAQTDLLIMTQDDVRFEPDTLKKIVKAFQDDFELTMVAPKIEPLHPETFFEKVIHIGTKIVYRVTKKWNKGNNYLASIGRCLAYRTEIIRRFEIDDKIINCDAYYYFENKRLAGNFKYLDDAVVYYRSPQNIGDHLKQVRKFVVSEKELSRYTIMDLDDEYHMPRVAFFRALLSELFIHPILSIAYVGVSFYARTRSKKFYNEVTRFWEVDKSTKDISGVKLIRGGTIKNQSIRIIKKIEEKIEYFSDFYKAVGFYKTCIMLLPKKGILNFVFKGIKYPIKIRLGTSDVPTFRDIFIKQEYALPFNFNPKLIIDAGANAGYASIFFANTYPEADIVAIEPENSNFNFLKDNITRYPKIKTVQAAIWSRKVLTKLSNKEEGNKHAFQIKEANEHDNNTINGLTIDDLLKNHHHPTIDILKLDIEGAERKIFLENYDGWLSKTKVICIELHDRLFLGCSKIFFEAAKKHGFKIVQENDHDFILINGNYDL